jgi:hypothetical protein
MGYYWLRGIPMTEQPPAPTDDDEQVHRDAQWANWIAIVAVVIVAILILAVFK